MVCARYNCPMSSDCLRCSKPTTSRSRTCVPCQLICACGKPKAHRSKTCMACRIPVMAEENRRRAKSPEARQIAAAGSRAYWAAHRRKYEDLRAEHFNMKRPDGRHYALYWPNGAKRRKRIYRNRWVWERANGPIPEGHVIHHKNEDKSDDALDNLELKTDPDHKRDHRIGPAGWDSSQDRLCDTCGKKWTGYRRPKTVTGKRFCSRPCRDVWLSEYHRGHVYRPGQSRASSAPSVTPTSSTT